MDAKDTAYWLLFIRLLHDRLRDNEYCATHTLVFGLKLAVGLANCSISPCNLRTVYISYVSHSWKDSVLDWNLAFSGMLCLIPLFNTSVTRHFEGAL